MCRQLKENPKTRGIPIILLCDKRLPPEIEQAHRYELETDDFFSKPVNPEELYRAIERLIFFP
jgi:CheY-like chemotaxis protein